MMNCESKTYKGMAADGTLWEYLKSQDEMLSGMMRNLIQNGARVNEAYEIVRAEFQTNIM